jgi:hypothetical protein
MNRKLQFGSWLIALGLGAAMALPLEAQNRPPRPRQEPQQQERRQEQRQERRNERPNVRNQGNPNRPPVTSQSVVPNTNRPPERAHNQQNRPPSAYAPPQRNLNSLSPQERQRTLDNYRNYQRLPQGQKQQMQEAARNWYRLTPDQKSHIKNDVMPRWQQLPPQRQRAIQQRLGVLKNMPEFARNQHLADPNFTRGMSEEDKSMLRDLSHLHVGGSPEEPHE